MGSVILNKDGKNSGKAWIRNTTESKDLYHISVGKKAGDTISAFYTNYKNDKGI